MSPRNPKLHKTYVKISPINYTKTIYDEELKESYEDTEKEKSFVIGGQVNNIGYYAYGSSSRASKSGEQQSESAYIIFSSRDCYKNNWRPETGDVITQLYLPNPSGDKDDFYTIDVYLEVTTVQPSMFYRGKNRAFHVYYSDITPKEKARNTR